MCPEGSDKHADNFIKSYPCVMHTNAKTNLSRNCYIDSALFKLYKGMQMSKDVSTVEGSKYQGGQIIITYPYNKLQEKCFRHMSRSL